MVQNKNFPLKFKKFSKFQEYKQNYGKFFEVKQNFKRSEKFNDSSEERSVPKNEKCIYSEETSAKQSGGSSSPVSGVNLA